MSQSAEWLLTVVDANVVKGFDLFTKSDLYVKIKVGDQAFQTNTSRNSTSPAWNQSFSFPMSNMYNNIEIRVMDNDFFRDDKIAVANIYANQLPTSFGEEKEYSIPLSYENKDIGILHIRIKNNNGNNMRYSDDRLSSSHNQPLNNNAYNQGLYSSNNYNVRNDTNAMNIGSGGYDSTALGGHSYNHNNNNNNNNDSNIIRDDRTNYNNVPSTGNNASLVAASAAAIPTISSDKKHKHKKDKKHKHHEHGPKVVLPEKHHHYEDGYTSSTSESSNEGEKRRAAEGKLGKYAYDAPLDNNDPYINNTVDVNGNLHTHGNVDNAYQNH